MNRSVIKPINTLSGLDFYQKIINKYKTGKIKALRFPAIIYYKNNGYLLHKKIDMSILLQMHLNNQNVLFSLFVKTIPAMKGMLSWLDTGNNTLISVLEPKNIRNVNNVKNFFTSNDAFNQQTAHLTHSNNLMVDPQILYYENKIKILNSQAFRMRISCQNYRSLNTIDHFTSVNKEATRECQFKSSTILSQDNLSFNSTILGTNKRFFKYLNQVTVNKPLIKNFYISFGYVLSRSIQRIYAYVTGLHNNKSKLPAILPHGNLFFNSKIFGINNFFFKEPNQVTVNGLLIKNYYESFKYGLSGSVQWIHANKTEYYGNRPKLPLILLHDILFYNSKIFGMSKLFHKYLNQVTVNESPIKNYYDSCGHTSSSSAKRTYAYKTESGIMRFQDSGHLEQEIEQIKKIIIQTKESMSEKQKQSFGEAEIKRHLDINRISDQVYQNIERAIRMERERRGI